MRGNVRTSQAGRGAVAQPSLLSTQSTLDTQSTCPFNPEALQPPFISPKPIPLNTIYFHLFPLNST